jgi:dihydrofolate synthase/folylpolyglutamate synthase
MKRLEQWLNSIFLDIKREYRELSSLEEYVVKLDLRPLAKHVITITGTNGKGSMAQLLDAIYRQADYRVAKFTSPHLMNFRERATLNGKMVDPDLLVEGFERVETVRAGRYLNTFDFINFALLWCIKQMNVDVAVLEVGLGGRLDLCNLFDADAVAISSIALDHTSHLGSTRESIGYEKAFLARAERPLVCGDKNPPATIAEMAQQKHAVLYQVDSKINGFCYKLHDDSWDWVGPLNVMKNLPVPRIKFQNAATALTVVDTLQKQLPVPETAIREVLAHCGAPGRFEIIQRECPIILDVAHNEQSCLFLAKRLQTNQPSGQTLIVFGLVAGKEMEKVLKALIPVADQWHLAPLDGRKSYSGEQIQQQLEALGVKNCYTSNDFQQALQAAYEVAEPNDRIVVCGSFMAVASAKQFLEA